MRHRRFDVAFLRVEQIELPLKAAYLLVADTEAREELEWECLAYALDPAPVAPGRYQLAVQTLDGRLLEGEAILVRSVDGAHVFRGTGVLDGVDPAELT